MAEPEPGAIERRPNPSEGSADGLSRLNAEWKEGLPHPQPSEGSDAASQTVSVNPPAQVVLKDRYIVERELGRGGMSVVYLARDRQLLEKRVVVKVLLDESHLDPWIRQKFQQEMEALARIDHPSVVGVLDTGLTPEGRPFLVMQYVEGVTLRSIIHAGRMPLARAASLIRAAGHALQAAHEKGVWHRDLKPDNIMIQSLGAEEYVKLIDFGIAAIQNSLFTGEQTKIAGTLGYMAPEQLYGQSCAATDTYSLGVVAWEMLAGEALFPPGSMAHLLQEDRSRTARIRQLRPDLPAAAESALNQAISFRPEDRHSSTVEFSEQLSQALSGEATGNRPQLAEPQIAHVLFAGLAENARLPSDEQKRRLAELEELLRQSAQVRSAEADGSLIFVPLAGGVALAFFSNAAVPAQCALDVSAQLRAKPHLRLRMGIHRGPVYRVAPAAQNRDVAGEGIQIARRVMDCGDAGHILVSEAAAADLLRSGQWAQYLRDLGECTLNAGLKIHVYNLATPEAGNARRPRRFSAFGATLTPKVLAATGLLVVSAGAFWLARDTRFSKPFANEASIAVLPFADMTPERNQEYFSDGLSEELMNALARTPGVRVAGRTSSFQFKGKNENSRSVGKKLNVAALLEGSVRKQGSRVRIAVELVRATDDANVWSATFDRDMSDIFAVEDEIAHSVSEELKPQLVGKKVAAGGMAPAAKTAAAVARGTSAPAHNAYLQGRYFLARGSAESNAKARDYFEEALRLDSGYAPSWVGLAESLIKQVGSGEVRSADGYVKAREALDRALALDPNLGDAHATMGELKMLGDWDWKGAEVSYQRALGLKPGDAGVLRDAGSLARIQGRLDDGVTLFRRAIEIDPLSGHYGLALILHYAGRQAEAKTALRKSLELDPERAVARVLLVRVYLADGQLRDALVEAESIKHPAWRPFGLALAYHALGRRKESDLNLEELVHFPGGASWLVAEVFAYRGEPDQAFAWLERAYTERDTGLAEMKADPLLVTVRRDPRFTALLQRMHL